MSIERHVEKHRATSRRDGRRASFDSFPFGAARLIKMNMRIDHARKNVQSSCVNSLTRRIRHIRPNVDDSTVQNREILSATFCRRYQSASTDDDVELTHSAISVASR